MKEIVMKRGQPITFRIPSDTPDHILKHLQSLKETERRNFSGKIASIVLENVGSSSAQTRETLTIPLPRGLTKEQRDWLKHEHSEVLLGNIVYQLLADPVRAVSILASLNSNAREIDDALYLQDIPVPEAEERNHAKEITELRTENEFDGLEDIQMGELDINDSIQDEEETAEEDPLADFLAQMNK